MNEVYRCPIQFLGPPPNGRNAYGLTDPLFSGLNLSGLNSPASSPQISSLLCKAADGIKINIPSFITDPFGKARAFEHFLEINAEGGLNLK